MGDEAADHIETWATIETTVWMKPPQRKGNGQRGAADSNAHYEQPTRSPRRNLPPKIISGEMS
jgi:hypothetical protein